MTTPPAPPPPPEAAAPAHTPQGRERAAVLDAVRPEVERELGKPVRFLVEALRVEGRWAFLRARLQDAHGGRFDYVGTPMADDAKAGLISDRYTALLSHGPAGWSLVGEAIGPTDVPEETWAQDYGAPADLFKQ